MIELDPRAEVWAALAELSRRYPDWRLGPLVANVADWADQGVWDVEDADLLRVARRHLAQSNSSAPDQEPAPQSVYKKRQTEGNGTGSGAGTAQVPVPLPGGNGDRHALRFEPVPVSASASPSRTPSQGTIFPWNR